MNLLPAAWRYAKGEGIGPTVRRVAATLARPVASRPRSLIYARDLAAPLAASPPPFESRIEELASDDWRLLSSVMYQSAREIRRRFSSGDRCFVSGVDDRIAHYEWVSFSQLHLDSLGRTLSLGPREAYVYNVRTLKPYRGRKLFASTLRAVGERLRAEGIQRLWIATDVDNVASQRAILAAGFTLVHDIRLARALGVKLREHWQTNPSGALRAHGRVAVRLCGSDDPAWRDYVGSSSSASLFHAPEWARIFTATLDADLSCALLAERSATPAGVLPLTLVTSRLAGRALVSQPQYMGGLAVDDEESAAALLAESVNLARELCVDYLEIRQQHTGTPDASEFGFQGVQRKSTFLLDVAPGESALWTSFRKQVRNRVRHAERSGVVVSRGSGDPDTRAFYRLMVASMRRLGSPVYGMECFSEVLREFPGQAEIFVAKVDDKPVAAKLVVPFKDQLHLLCGATDQRFRSHGSNYLLTWSVIRHAMQAGLSTVNFGRSTTGSSAAAFKKQWLTEEVPLTWWYMPVAADRVPELNPDARRWLLARAAWRRLPSPLTEQLGPRIARQIP